MKRWTLSSRILYVPYEAWRIVGFGTKLLGTWLPINGSSFSKKKKLAILAKQTITTLLINVIAARWELNYAWVCCCWRKMAEAVSSETCNLEVFGANLRRRGRDLNASCVQALIFRNRKSNCRGRNGYLFLPIFKGEPFGFKEVFKFEENFWK